MDGMQGIDSSLCDDRRSVERRAVPVPASVPTAGRLRRAGALILPLGEIAALRAAAKADPAGTREFNLMAALFLSGGFVAGFLVHLVFCQPAPPPSIDLGGAEYCPAPPSVSSN